MALAGGAQTFLNADETALFTDFQLTADQRIRPPSAEASVLVSRGGGRALVSGKTLLEVHDDEFLEVGQRYALFLCWAPEFKAHLLDSVLPIAGGQVIMPNGLEPEAEFLARLKIFATKLKEA